MPYLNSSLNRYFQSEILILSISLVKNSVLIDSKENVWPNFLSAQAGKWESRLLHRERRDRRWPENASVRRQGKRETAATTAAAAIELAPAAAT